MQNDVFSVPFKSPKQVPEAGASFRFFMFPVPRTRRIGEPMTKWEMDRGNGVSTVSIIPDIARPCNE